ncbi:MAG: peptidoglycan-binding protein LysM [Olleya sp.]
MKNNIGKLSLVLTISILVIVVYSVLQSLKEIMEDTSVENCYQPEAFTPHLGKTFTGFKEALGFKESQNDYFRVNQYGYLGKYQFGKSTLKVIGIHHPNFFLNNPELQEKAFIANAQRNKWVLRRDIKRYKGMYINGVKVTESGILAAAHLAGPGSVKEYLRSHGENRFSDANGASIKYYMKKFSGYDTSLIQPLKRVKVKYTKA